MRRSKLGDGRSSNFWSPSSKTRSKLKDLQKQSYKLVKIREKGRKTQDWGRMAECSPWPKWGEKARPFSAKGPFYRWLARPRSGAECASASMQCSAAELDFRRPNLDCPHSCFRGPNARPKCMHVRRPNLRFGGRTWSSSKIIFMQKLIFLLI